MHQAEEKKRKVSSVQEATPTGEPPEGATSASSAVRPLTIARQVPLGSRGASSTQGGGAAASAAPPTGQKRKSEGEGDEDRAELAPSDQRSEAQKRKATEDAEGMIDEIIA